MPAHSSITVAVTRIKCMRRAVVFAWLAATALMLVFNAQAAEPALEIAVGNPTVHMSRTELLAHPALRTIEVPADVAYHRAMHYRALPLSALVAQLAQTGTLQFTAADGFVANIPGALFAGGAQPWLAIEPADAPWPALKPGGVSAGPFYLVWLTPEKSAISPEQWPYQIAKIAAALPIDKRYPQLVPTTTGASNPAAQRGMHVYIANCATCHQLNGGGDAAIGPDLNKPFSPTDYFQEPYLRKLIRDPASVRNWGKRAMPGFASSVLSDAKLDDLLAYLRQMAKQR